MSDPEGSRRIATFCNRLGDVGRFASREVARQDDLAGGRQVELKPHHFGLPFDDPELGVHPGGAGQPILDEPWIDVGRVIPGERAAGSGGKRKHGAAGEAARIEVGDALSGHERTAEGQTKGSVFEVVNGDDGDQRVDRIAKTVRLGRRGRLGDVATPLRVVVRKFDDPELPVHGADANGCSVERRLSRTAPVQTAPAVQFEPEAPLETGEAGIALGRPRDGACQLDVDRIGLDRLREPKLGSTPENHVGRSEERERRREEVRLPTEDVVVLAEEDIDDVRFDFGVRVSQADGRTGEKRTFRRQWRRAWLVSEQIELEHAGHLRAGDVGGRHLEADARVARRGLRAPVGRAVHRPLQLVRADREVGRPRSVGPQNRRVAGRIAEALGRIVHPVELEESVERGLPSARDRRLLLRLDRGRGRFYVRSLSVWRDCLSRRDEAGKNDGTCS